MEYSKLTPVIRLGRRFGCVVLLGMASTGCASTPTAPQSTCMQRTLDSLHLEGLADSRQHCLAAGIIQLRCGRWAALAAGYGKEFGDLFGPGTFERRDLRANRIGRQCARQSADENLLGGCCEAGNF